jgi:hypothetical protein
MCFKQKTAAAETAVPAQPVAQAASNAEGASTLVKGGSAGGASVQSTSGDDISQKRRRRSASQGLGL